MQVPSDITFRLDRGLLRPCSLLAVGDALCALRTLILNSYLALDVARIELLGALELAPVNLVAIAPHVLKFKLGSII